VNPRPALVILAAGLARRYGRLKQLDPVGPGGEALLDYAIFDARREGYGEVVLVTREELEPELRQHLDRVHGDLPVRFCRQRPDDLPGGHAAPAGRERPWGTGHAVLAARAAVHIPFAACNADDFYGRAAWAALGRHLAASSGAAVVGYPLASTLSAAGGVSRGIVVTGGDGRLRALGEVADLKREGARILGRTLTGEPLAFPPETPVSMNLFGLPSRAFALLEEKFGAWLATHAESATDEFYLSSTVHDLVGEGRLAVRVLPGGADWMGMTHPADRESVVRRLADLHARGVYPGTLRQD
jgi:hypothetical protein